MRYLFIITIISLSLPTYPQGFKTDSLGRYSFTDTVYLDSVRKQRIFETASRWFGNNFKHPRGKITKSNDSLGVINAKGRIHVHYRTVYLTDGGRIYFDMKFQACEEKYWFELTNLVHDGRSIANRTGGKLENKIPDCGLNYLEEDIWREIKVDGYLRLKKMVLEFKEEMALTPNIREELEW